MLQLVQSNRAEALLLQLGDDLQQRAADAPVLEPQTVLVQSQGMRQWLTLELAQRRGIVANLQTPMPASFLWQLCGQVMGADLAASSAFDKHALCWRIVAGLPGWLDQQDFAPLRDYLGGHRHEQLRRYQLAYRIADLLDQYLVYRPDWILAWERGDDGGVAPEQAWQPRIWRLLAEEIAAELGQKPLHRANIHDEVRRRLSQGEFEASLLPRAVSVFGVSSLPPQQLDLLEALGQCIPVTLYAVNPCAQYWGDIVSEKALARKRTVQAGTGSVDDAYYQVGNPLLASWGAQGREFFDLLLERRVVGEEGFVDATPTTLLTSVQSQILQLTHPCEGAKTVLSAEDRSIQVHSCHSRMREVEVLHDQLLAQLSGDQDLKARDIVVMVPDIAAYAPFVHAVFGQRRDHPGYMRYTLSDRSSADESPLLQSFLSLLELPESRLSAPEIIDLLEVPAIARRLGFGSAELALIGHWIGESGIRWARDGADKQRWGLPAEPGNSWRFGLDRLYLGYAMGTDERLFEGQLPCAEVDGGNGALLGRLHQFLDQLNYWREQFQQSHSWNQWLELLNQCIDELFEPRDEDSLVLDGLRQQLAIILQDETCGQLQEPITPALLRSLVLGQLAESGGGLGFLAGGITFCTLMPMRSIPFRVVCLLGMNDKEFPRQHTVPGFDLLAADRPRRGDRNRRSDDRYQMLEALLAARDCFYVSFIGRDVLDNSGKVASVLLSELLEYCESAFVFRGDEQLPALDAAAALRRGLVVQHHLQPFDARYFQAVEPPWFSYAREYFNAARSEVGNSDTNWAAHSLPPLLEPDTSLRLESLQALLANPCKLLLQQRLAVYLDIRDEELANTEVFKPDGLERYFLRDGALRAQLRGDSPTLWQAQCRAAGTAPVGAAGAEKLSQVWADMTAVAGRLEPLLQGQSCNLAVDIRIADVRIEGELGALYGDHRVHWKPGKLRARDFLQQWLRHVLANRVGGPVRSYMVDQKGAWQFEPIDNERGREYLEVLLAWYRIGMERPLHLFPESAWAMLKEEQKSGDMEAAMGKAAKTWGGTGNSAERDDIYFARCYGMSDVLDDEFVLLARELVAPALYAWEKVS